MNYKGIMRYILIILLLFFGIAVFGAEYAYTPAQTSAMRSKINGNLAAGDIVYLENGTYTDCLLTFKGNGTAANPITLKARNAGGVVFTGSLRLQISGSYLIADGLVFKNGTASNSDIIEFRTSSSVFANNCRLTNCVIDNCNNPALNKAEEKPSERWVMLYGKNNRVDHCYFARKDRSGVLMMVSLNAADCRENNHLIDHNFFGYREVLAAGNGGETIRLGDSGTSVYSCKTIVEHNFFYRCDGEAEIISVKSADNMIRRNTFYESAGAVVCRHGKNNTIHSNVFIGNNKANCGGVRIINEGHKVYNNFFQELAGTTSRSALCVMTAVFENPTAQTDTQKEPLNAYHRVKNADIVHNTFVGCKSIEIGTVGTYTYASDSPYRPGEKLTGTLYPQNLTIANNIIYNPTDKSIWKEISSSSVSGTWFEYNLCAFNSDFTHNGFINYPISCSKHSGIYLLENSEKMPAPTDYDYVQTDITGTIRMTSQKDAGSQEVSNRLLPYDAAKPDECGTIWYEPQQSEMNAALSKTTFFPTLTTSVKEIRDNNQIRIICKDHVLFVCNNTLINQLSLYNMEGLPIKTWHPYQCDFSFPLTSFPKGIYLCKIQTEDEKYYSHKIIVER